MSIPNMVTTKRPIFRNGSVGSSVTTVRVCLAVMNIRSLVVVESFASLLAWSDLSKPFSRDTGKDQPDLSMRAASFESTCFKHKVLMTIVVYVNTSRAEKDLIERQT